MYLGIEIGGTKLQLGLGRGDGEILKLWRGKVDAAAGGVGIRRQIIATVPELLADAGIEKAALRGVGVGFGGPTDDATQSVIKSHQVDGWDDFPLAEWLTDHLGQPAVICNDADVAGLGEALFGAGKGLSPIFYITVGTGVGGGLVIDGQIYRGVGRGAAEIGHVRAAFHNLLLGQPDIIENVSSGTAIGNGLKPYTRLTPDKLTGRTELLKVDPLTGERVVEAARRGDEFAGYILRDATKALAEGICTVIALLCPRRVIIGGGVSLIGEELFFEPIRRYVNDRGFAPFRGLTDIVPAALGEEVVVHGALALARAKLGG